MKTSPARSPAVYARRPLKRHILAIAATLVAACIFGGCGDVKVREYNAARWLAPETSFVYVQHDFVVGGEGGSLGRPASNSYPRSSIEVFRLELGPSGFTGKTRLFGMDRVVPCAELVYRSADSLLMLSYVELDGSNGMMRHGCPDTLRRLALGKLNGASWTALEAPAPDSLRAYLDMLRDSRVAAQGEGSLLIDSANERLCAGGYCIRTGDKP